MRFIKKNYIFNYDEITLIFQNFFFSFFFSSQALYKLVNLKSPEM